MAKLQLLKKKSNDDKQMHARDSIPKTSILGELKLVEWSSPRNLFWLMLYTVILTATLSAIMMGLDNFYGILRDSIIK